ncbi:unnamed protein product [Clonostachys byssicola]|uniref:Uncharacterized protein n=1 Tax=Clonostachys byssicola TaxID=160290 RepID=A0A9N9UHW7_9HYPO|nr:unnamed protein product [Clonostachys byssicola]
MEKSMKLSAGELDATVMEEASTPTKAPKFLGLQKLGKLLGVEVQGNDPIVPKEKKDRRYFKLFTLWFSMNFNLLAISTGMSGTLGFGLSLRDCSLVILFFALLISLAAPYLSLFGVKLGLRQMIQARFSFGKYGVAIPLILNMATLFGYAILGSILGGQALSAINPEGLSVNVGIVILAIIDLILIFFGSRLIHQFDIYAWFPTLVAILVAVGCSGKHLHNQSVTEPATASSVLSFASLIAGFFLPWSAIASDFTTYFDSSSKTRAFTPSYIGLVVGGVPLMILGAAIGGAVPNVPAWEEGYNSTSVGGVLAAMLQPVGGFGKFLLVLLALSVLANIVGSVYALTLNFQALFWLLRIRLPRLVYTIVATAVIIPVAIKVAAEFLSSLSNFLGIIGYWPACFVAVILVEHFIFRKGQYKNYNIEQWDKGKELPLGVAALAASICSFGLVVPGMSQIWFTGPLAVYTGDIGFETAFVVTAICYVPFRYIEKKLTGR